MEHAAWSPLLLALAVFWSLVHFTHRRYAKPAGLLPTLARPATHRLSLGPVHLALHTTALNPAHAALTSRLHAGPLRRVLAALYDWGTAAGVVGMACTPAVLLYIAGSFALALDGREPRAVFARRGIKDMYVPAPPPQEHITLPVQLLVPGVTVPLAHLPLLLLALVLSHVVHEAGHFLVAALDALPLSAVGAALTLLIPSAFVVLPAAPTAALSPHKRLRLAGAGAFHNLVLYALVLALAPIGAALLSLAYEDVHTWGRVVLAVAPESALAGHLPPGALITKLDDWDFASAPPDVDIWESYLSHEPSPMQDNGLGWCVDSAWFAEQSETCCTAPNASAPLNLACFASYAPPASRCADPLPLFDPPAGSAPRCGTPLDCGGGGACVWPRADQELLRLTVRTEGRESVIVWNGPRADVLADVDVGTRRPRARGLPLALPGALALFAAYMQMLNLSLFFLNLLPVAPLDGGQFLDAFLDFLSGRDFDHMDLEGGIGVAAGDARVVWRAKAYIQFCVRVVILGLLGSSVVLGLAYAFLS